MLPIKIICVLSALCCLAGELYAAPQIEVIDKRISLGDFPANESVSSSAAIKNSGDEKLVISNIRSTCGCTVGSLTKTELESGESTEIEVKILPESITGPFSKALFIQSNAPLATIYVSGNSIPLVRVLPQNHIYVGSWPVGKEWRQEFILKTSEEVQWGDVEVTAGESVKIVFVKHPEVGNRYILIVKFTPKMPQQTFKIELKIPIIEPKEWKPVEIAIYGKTIESL